MFRYKIITTPTRWDPLQGQTSHTAFFVRLPVKYLISICRFTECIDFLMLKLIKDQVPLFAFSASHLRELFCVVTALQQDLQTMCYVYVQDYFYSLQMGSIAGSNLSCFPHTLLFSLGFQTVSCYTFILLVQERHFQRKVSCPSRQHHNPARSLASLF